MVTSSAKSSVVPVPLVVPERSVAKHFRSMEAILDAHIAGTASAKLFADWNVVPLVAGLIDTGCEYVARNRGRPVPVARILPLGEDLWAWFSYREEWARERPAGRTRRFSFRSVGLTIHFGYLNNQHKPQMFRAEWAGWASWNGTDYGHQAGDAAHPHWQFDALESLRRDDAVRRAADSLAVLRMEKQETEPRDFSPQSIGLDDVRDLVSTRKLSRIHFASGAAWWKGPSMDAHAHSPTSVTEIQVWVKKTLGYVVRELGRLRR